MKKFKLVFGENGKECDCNPLSAKEVYESVSFKDEIILRDIDPGESHVDSDGDTWTRLE